jgi:hypothetical protein
VPTPAREELPTTEPQTDEAPQPPAEAPGGATPPPFEDTPPTPPFQESPPAAAPTEPAPTPPFEETPPFEDAPSVPPSTEPGGAATPGTTPGLPSELPAEPSPTEPAPGDAPPSETLPELPPQMKSLTPEADQPPTMPDSDPFKDDPDASPLPGAAPKSGATAPAKPDRRAAPQVGPRRQPVGPELSATGEPRRLQPAAARESSRPANPLRAGRGTGGGVVRTANVMADRGVVPAAVPWRRNPLRSN